MEDNEKIGAKIIELQNQTGDKWVHVRGFFALTGFNFPPEGSESNPQFNPAYGIPVKVFLNEATGEIRTFEAIRFKAS